jgi:hypothetical protein
VDALKSRVMVENSKDIESLESSFFISPSENNNQFLPYQDIEDQNALSPVETLNRAFIELVVPVKSLATVLFEDAEL